MEKENIITLILYSLRISYHGFSIKTNSRKDFSGCCKAQTFYAVLGNAGHFYLLSTRTSATNHKADIGPCNTYLRATRNVYTIHFPIAFDWSKGISYVKSED